ncbi:PspC domain-containing protein [Marinoscillum sp. MHG1-6]|uniref:PspC domain-containing protein n=1 Tax=Marinoscillum sp. MHG1-6 TaxID=2959627 RepID=UPI0021571204|nr:PspC domain-containing protein [Marinoscillum sp. MHG1-6]
MTKRLTRSKDRMIAGVCGGIAQYLNLDPTIIRIAYVILTIFSFGFGVLIYLILWIIMPEA